MEIDSTLQPGTSKSPRSRASGMKTRSTLALPSGEQRGRLRSHAAAASDLPECPLPTDIAARDPSAALSSRSVRAVHEWAADRDEDYFPVADYQFVRHKDVNDR